MNFLPCFLKFWFPSRVLLVVLIVICCLVSQLMDFVHSIIIPPFDKMCCLFKYYFPLWMNFLPCFLKFWFPPRVLPVNILNCWLGQLVLIVICFLISQLMDFVHSIIIPPFKKNVFDLFKYYFPLWTSVVLIELF